VAYINPQLQVKAIPALHAIQRTVAVKTSQKRILELALTGKFIQ
jgi:hypothetical protein